MRKYGKGQPGFDLSAEIRDLTNLKAAYITVYSELHRKLALTAGGDDQRQRLYRDPRLESLKALSAIDLLSRGGELEVWKNQLTGLLSCREFHDGVLSNSPTCPYCHLRPAQRMAAPNADQTVRLLDDRLSAILKNWRQSLRTNLQSETAKQSLEAMSQAEKRPIDLFLTQSDDEETLPAGFVQAAIQALRGIQAVTLTVTELIEAIKNGGLPCTREELLARFKVFLDGKMRGHDAGNTRLTLDQ